MNAHQGTLPATMDYASPLQKRRLDTFGLLYGCHTCGRRQVRVDARVLSLPPDPLGARCVVQ